jgi:protein-S-isoprenylcysteine O-methyltransferase
MSFSDKRGLGRVALGGALLGLLFGGHLVWCALRGGSHPTEFQWCVYALCLCCFHFTEFLVTALYQPQDVSFDSFLINHSRAYTLAAVASWLEFWVEAAALPGLKGWRALQGLGVGMMLGGQALRTLAMCTAGSNFTHLVATTRTDTHVLVDRGVYAYLRHPAYLGWLAWSVGTQVALGNPLCTLLYAVASWSFFADRIPVEEVALLNFFGARYARYARATIIGIPGIRSPAAEVDAARLESRERAAAGAAAAASSAAAAAAQQ